MDQFAKPRVDEVEGEDEAPAADILMPDHQPARRQPAWPAQPDAEQTQEIMIADEQQGAVLGREAERDADAVPEIFLQPGWTGEALGALDDLGEVRRAAVIAAPILAVSRAILGDADGRGHGGIAAQRQWCADQPRGLRQQPACRRHPAFDH